MAERLDEQTMALRVAREFQNGMVVNLGAGTPVLASNYVPEGREVIFQSENGCLGYGRIAQTDEERDFNLINAGGQFVVGNLGMCFFDHAESFSMIRGGHIDLCVLGGLQVSEKGDLANWLIPGREPGAIGGAMDLAFGAARLVIVMTHTTKEKEPLTLKQLWLKALHAGGRAGEQMEGVFKKITRIGTWDWWTSMLNVPSRYLVR